uniref:Large ribosomal subunit protein uL3c n=1 Tax=Schizocladia ischiensis TaxID=196139 RepID=A0A7S6ZPA7_9STRA|nr:ribosomal protein L3 [Schizocladia ischiensis]QOW07534.1 ribosomal protein L3 [Schizocladia ischiensis]
MSIGILGNKIGMTQIFDEEGLTIPVTVIRVGPCKITQIKTHRLNGYNAIQLGYSQVKPEKLTKPKHGHLKKVGCFPLYHLREYKVSKIDKFLLGETLTVDIFKIGQYVNISGQSIGKGFSGNQKRHNFKRGPMTHGSKNHRAPGSIGPGSTPGRVFPGKKMAGQYGAKKITISKLRIIGIDKTRNLLIIKGNVPGKPGNLLNIVGSN